MASSGDGGHAPDDLVSLCHGAPVRLAEDAVRGWECTGCGEPCDVTTRAQDEAWRDQVEFLGVPPGQAGGEAPGAGC